MLEERGCRVRANDFVGWWLNCIPYDLDDYGVAKSNMHKGLRPPLTGSYNNWFKDCMGSPIRSEIWVCLAPAYASRLAQYAEAMPGDYFTGCSG